MYTEVDLQVTHASERTCTWHVQRWPTPTSHSADRAVKCRSHFGGADELSPFTFFLLIIISCNAETHLMEFTHQIRIKGSRLRVDLLYTTMTATLRPMLTQRLTTLRPSRTETRIVNDRSPHLHLIKLDSMLSSLSFLKRPRV